MLHWIFILFQVVRLAQSLNIDDFGAISGDTSYNSSIINGKAFYLAVLAANNGTTDRTVVISHGKTYNMLPWTNINGVNNVTIQLDGTIGCYIEDKSKWPTNGNDNKGSAISLISLSNCNGLIFKGNGKIDGFGYEWWWEVILSGYDNRPNLVSISNANNTLIDGFTLVNSPQYHMALFNHLNLTVKNIQIYVNITGDNTSIPIFPLNTDGIDISGKDIYLTNLTIENFDDAVAVKPLQNRPDNYVNCTQNVLIENSFVKYGVGMSIGSVPPNTDVNCVRNVTIRNIKFEQPLKAIYIKPNPGDQGKGIIGNITYENIEINDALWWAIFIGTQQQHQPHNPGTDCSFFFPLPGTECIADGLVTVQNITLRNINIYKGLLSPGILLCNESNPCTNFLFDNVNVYNSSTFPMEGYLCENVQLEAINSNIYPKCSNTTTLQQQQQNKYEKFKINKSSNYYESLKKFQIFENILNRIISNKNP